jgi:two-component system, OmpR family, KDP operon response regulator KdpE
MSHGRTSILVVDDDPGILIAITQALTTHQYEVWTAANGGEALDIYERTQPDLILLDLMMPHIDGLEFCRRIRANATTPIIILSVKGSETDIVTALDLGADDYLVKPFRLAELLARVRAVLRRGSQPGASQIMCGDLEIDTERHTVAVAGYLVTLSPIEFAVLAELARNMGRVVTNRTLLQKVWGTQYLDADDYIKSVIRRLRVKLEPDPAHPRYILTERYLGYRLIDL